MTKNAIGTHRQTLQLNGRDWSLDAAEANALEVFLTELRKARYWKHETWCHLKAHEQNAEGAGLDETPCIGRMIQVDDEFGGWWHQADVGQEARFYVDRNLRFGPSWDATADDVRAVLGFAAEGSPVRQLLGQALADYEGASAAGGQS